MEIIFEFTLTRTYSTGEQNMLADYKLTSSTMGAHYVLLSGGERLGEFDKYEDALTQMNNLKGGE